MPARSKRSEDCSLRTAGLQAGEASFQTTLHQGFSRIVLVPSEQGKALGGLVSGDLGRSLSCATLCRLLQKCKAAGISCPV